MHHQTPEWVEGTMYGSAQLEIFEDGDNLLLQCPVWVRLQLARQQWHIAMPLVHYDQKLWTNLYRGKLSNLALYTEMSEVVLHAAEIHIEDICGSIHDFHAKKCSLEEWQAHPEEPADFPLNFAVLNATPTANTLFNAFIEGSADLYARRYQLPANFAKEVRNQIALPNQSQLYFYAEPRKGYTLVSLWSDQNWGEYEKCVVLALELLAGAPSSLTQRISGAEHSFFTVAEHITSPFSAQHPSAHPLHLIEHLVHCFAAMPPDIFKRFRVCCRQHLFAKGRNMAMETRYVMAMTWIDMLDGTYTLQHTTTAKLLGIGVAGAEMLQEVRNKLIHDAASFDEAIQLALDGICSPRRANQQKLAPITMPHAAHMELICWDLGLEVDVSHPEFPIYLICRLIERIDTAIWWFLKIPPQKIQRLPHARWSREPPIPEMEPPEFQRISPLPALRTT